MRAAYLTVLDESAVEPRDGELLNAVIAGDRSYALHQGWVCTGSRWNVPHHAWLVAHCGSTYAWVMPENAAEFSRFVLLVLHIETVAPAGTRVVPGGPGPRAPTDSVTPGLPFSPFAPRLFDVPAEFNPGLFFLPRR